MTTNYHTPIPEGAPANAETFNEPLGEMDEALTEALLEERDGHIIQEEGVDLAQQARLDFAGAGVTVTNEVGKTLVTIPGGVTDHGALSGLSDDDHPQYLLASGLREWDEQVSDPGTPATGKWKVYFKAGGLYLIDDAGVVIGPVGSGRDKYPMEFRLTLATGTPVTTTDQTAKTTIYATPFNGNQIALYDGVATWTTYTSAEFSLALGTLSSGKPYDVFCYANSGVPTLEFLAWTNATTRATALTTQDGVLVKSGATTRRYLGTFYTVSATTTEDSLANRLLQNYYNQVPRPLHIKESTDSWSYTTATYRNVNNASANALKIVTGQPTMLCLNGLLIYATSASGARMAFGEDGTSPDSLCVGLTSIGGTLSASPTNGLITWLQKYPSVGYHVYNWLERGNTGVTFYGDNADATLQQSGVHGWIMG